MKIFRPALSLRNAVVTVTIASAVLMTLTFLHSTSASSARGFLRLDQLESVSVGESAQPTPAAQGAEVQYLLRSRLSSMGPLAVLLPPLPGESIATFAANCTTPKTSFNLGDTVCARAVGAPPPFFGFALRRFNWADPIPLTLRVADITTDPATDLFTLPSTQTSTVAGITVDNRGTWRVNDTSGIDGTVIATAFFTVTSAAAPVVDLSVSTTVNPNTATPAANSTVEFVVFIRNNGPNDAATVTLTNPTPANTSWLSIIKDPSFTCVNPPPGGAGTSICSIANLASGATAIFRYSYAVNLNTPDGTKLTDSISIASATSDNNPDNNSSAADAIVNTSPCTITPPSNISQNNDLHQGGATVIYAPPTTTAPCGQVDCVLPSGSFFPVGINTVTCANDAGDFARFTVTVNDTESPAVTCPANVTAAENPHGSGSAFVNFPDPQATDNGPVTVTTDHASGSNFPLGTTTVTATATDVSNNTATCTFTVTVVPSDCTITCPSNVAQEPDAGQNGAIVNYPAATTTGTTCGAITYSQTSGTFFPLGTTTVTVTATGGETCSFTVTVTTDTTPPTITCPAAIVQAVTSGCQADVTTGTPTAADNNPGVTVSGARLDGQPLTAPYLVGETIIIWTATDVGGNTASCNQSIKVTESVPPSVTAPAPVTVNVNASCDNVEVPNFITTLVASDDCTPRANLEISQAPGAETLVGVGSHTVTITVKDISGNTTIVTTTFVVVDNVAPTIALTGPGSVTVECHTSFTDPGATASDNCAGTFAATASGSVNVNTPGVYTVTYNASDPSGNAATAVTRTVNVVDTTVPTITCPANITVDTEPGSCSAHVSPTASAADSCDASPTVAGIRSDGQPLNALYPKGTTTITWTATDSSGNHSSSCVQTITVVDHEPPTISCSADIVADFNPAVNGAAVSYTTPVGSDNCGGATTVQIAGLASGATFPLGTTTNTFTVTDAAGNTASCSFKITVALTSIVGLDSVTITGSGLVDSYDSTIGYPASKGAVANILSNGTITLGNSGKVSGNVRSTRAGINMTGASLVTGNATAGTTVSTSGSASVGGTRTNNALAPVMTLPSVPACAPFSSNSGISGTYTYSASTGDLILSGVNIATLANGNYCFHNVTLGNSAQLKVNGPVVIKMTGILNTSGATSLPNSTLNPSNLQILSSYSGSGNGVVFGNSSNLQLVVYAPQTGVNISGSAPLFGTVAAKSITLGNSGMIHYDTQLKTIWPGIWTLIFGP